MRIIVAALAAALLVVSLTGCSSSDTPAAASEPAPAPAPAAAPKPQVSKTNLLSPSEIGTGTLFPVGLSTPKAIKTSISKHQPMLILFYDPKQNASTDQRVEIDAAMKDYRGMIDLLTYDVTGALPDPVTKTPPTQEEGQVALLVQDLGVGYTPYVVIVDSRGMITSKYRGFVDRDLLRREILEATQ